jgi:hypothetical protein
VAYQIDPTPLSRHRTGRILVVTAIAAIGFALVVGALAVMGRTDAGIASVLAPTPSPSLATAAPPSAVPVTPRPATPKPYVWPGPPPAVDCHDLPGSRCAEVAHAVLAKIADPSLPRPTKVDVWASLLCSDAFDCPPYYLGDHRTIGSAVVRSDGSTPLLLNVTQSTNSPDHGSIGPDLDVWEIASRPVP